MSLTAHCHSGRTAFEIDGERPEKLTRCTCSFCSKRGTLYAYYQPPQFRIKTPAADVATYRWNTKKVAHSFGATSGCGTFSDSPNFKTDGSWDGTSRRIGSTRGC